MKSIQVQTFTEKSETKLQNVLIRIQIRQINCKGKNKNKSLKEIVFVLMLLLFIKTPSSIIYKKLNREFYILIFGHNCPVWRRRRGQPVKVINRIISK